MNENKYTRQWEVPSASSKTGKTYIISLTHDGNYECSCPRWVFAREDCKHIEAIKDGEWDDNTVLEYEMQPGNVGQVTKKSETLFYIPLVPFNDDGIDLLATIVYDLLQFGVPWRQIKERYGKNMIPKEWKKDMVISHVQTYGRGVYTEWIKGQGWTNFQHLRV